MRFRSRLYSVAAFTLASLVPAHAGESATDASIALGKQLFQKAVPACAICHTLKDAGASGAIGPSLDELRPNEQRVIQALRTGIGQMPPYASLSDKEIAALAQYVSRVTGGSAPQ